MNKGTIPYQAGAQARAQVKAQPIKWSNIINAL